MPDPIVPDPVMPDGEVDLSMVDRPLVTVVVVAYNNADHIAGCLDSALSELPSDGSRLVVLDNASSDDTADRIEEGWPQVDLIRSEENLGFGRACNRAAAETSSRFVLLLNPDATMLPGCLGTLLDLAERQPLGGLYGGRVYTRDGDVDPMSCSGRPTLWSTFCFATGLSAIFASSAVFNQVEMGSWARDEERQVDVITGCLLLADRVAWERLGGFDERFFMYGEDIDLSLRAAALGYEPTFTPDAGISHIGGASSSAVNMQILLYRGKVSLIRKLWDGPRRSVAEALLLAGVALRGRLGTVAARLKAVLGRGSSQTSPSAWSALWDRRAEWRDGWPPAP